MDGSPDGAIHGNAIQSDSKSLNPQRPKKTRRGKKKPKGGPTRALANAIVRAERPKAASSKPRVAGYGPELQRAIKARVALPSAPGIRAEVKSVLAMITSPHCSMPMRIPDRSMGKPTALVISVRYVDVNVNMNDPVPANNGKFSICCQPHLGSPSALNDYKVAVVTGLNSLGTWPVNNFGLASQYTQFSTFDGSDLRTDPNYFELTGNEKGFYRAIGNVDPAGGVYEGPFGATASLALNAENYNIVVGYTSTTTAAFVGTSFFNVAAGNYLVNIILRGLVAEFVAGVVLASGGGAQIVLIQNAFFPGSAGPPAAGANQFIEFFLSVPVTTGSQPFFSLTYVAGSVYGPSSTGQITITSVAPAQTAAILPNYTEYQDGGNVQQYRPVAMSALFTFMGSDLINGGEIAACVVTGNTSRTSYFTNSASASIGHLQETSNLGKLPLAYSGRLKDGAYGYWTWEDIDDSEFVTPSAALNADYQSIIISGQSVPQQAVASTILVGRLVLTTVYEIRTETTLFPLEYAIGCAPVFDEVMAILARSPKVMANAEHVAWLKDLMARLKQAGRNAYSFWDSNKNWIVPAAQGVASLL